MRISNSARAAAVVFALLAGAAPMHAQQPPTATVAAAAGVDTLALRAHTRFLADDLLRGRAAGSDGERIAAAYIESQLIRLGLAPVGGASFRRPVPLTAVRIAEGTSLVVERPAEPASRRYASPRDFIVGTGGAQAFTDFDGHVLFAGSPLEAGPALRGLELDGAVIAMTGLPGAAAATLIPDWIRRGVRGVLLLAPDAEYFELVARSRGDDRLYVDARVDDPVWQPALPSLVLGPELSAAMLADASERHAARLAASGADRAAASAALPVDWRIDATIRVDPRPLTATNVVGMVEGTDPARRDEFIVYTAHYDHLGVGVPDAAGDSIYNGFSDNAAGVAMLLAIAQQVQAAPPPRSVLFLFLAAEERGLLGSTYLATSPPVPLENMRALINLDAGAPPSPPTSWRIAAGPGAESALATANDIASQNDWRVDVGPATPNSDHWPFAARGVPAIFIIPGADWEATPAEAARLRDRFERYHQPGDHWHPDFPFSGLQRYAAFALEIGRQLTTKDEF